MIILKTLGIALLLILAAFSILCGLLRWLSK